jgi:hypothetical protein
MRNSIPRSTSIATGWLVEEYGDSRNRPAVALCLETRYLQRNPAVRREPSSGPGLVASFPRIGLDDQPVRAAGFLGNRGGFRGSGPCESEIRGVACHRDPRRTGTRCEARPGTLPTRSRSGGSHGFRITPGCLPFRRSAEAAMRCVPVRRGTRRAAVESRSAVVDPVAAVEIPVLLEGRGRIAGALGRTGACRPGCGEQILAGTDRESEATARVREPREDSPPGRSQGAFSDISVDPRIPVA